MTHAYHCNYIFNVKIRLKFVLVHLYTFQNSVFKGENGQPSLIKVN